MKTLKTNITSLLFLILLSSCTFNASLKNLEAELGKGDQSSSPVLNLQKIFVDVTSITITEGSVAIINVAVNPIQTTDTIIDLNLSTSSGSYIRFNPIPSQIIIPAGSTSKSIVLNTIDDSLLQDQEVWSFSISSPDPNLQADPGLLSVTLNDNDGGVIPGAPTGPMAKLLKEFNPYPSTVSKLAFNGKVFYVGSDAANGAELWVTDGTPNGTYLVKDIEPGLGSSNPADFFHPPNSSYIFFTATTSSEGEELWVSDGTESGTHMITKGFEPGTVSALPNIYLAHDDKLYYTSTTTVDGRELYVTDGTAAGTKMLIEYGTGSFGVTYASIYPNGNELYIALYGAPSYYSYIYISDGTPAGTTLAVNAKSSGANLDDVIMFDTMYNGKLYFNFYDWSAGSELYSTGLTNASTGLVKDIYTGSSSSYTAASKHILNGKLLLLAIYDSSSETTGYWITDGTTAGTTKVTQSISLSGVLGVLPGEKLIISGCTSNYNCELYSTSGVNNDAVMLKDIYPGSTNGNGNSSSPAFVAKVADKIFFTATTENEGSELWVTDGTSAGTVLLKDINVGKVSSSPSNFNVMGSKLLFTAKSSSYGEEIWITDGTPAGTSIFKDLVPGITGSGPKNLTIMDPTQLFFTAYNSMSGFASIFVSDISNYNTLGIPHAMVESLNSETKNFVEYNGLVYFDAMDSSTGAPLWVTNGTVSGTTKIKDLMPSATCSDINYMTTYNGSIFFTVTTEANGNELFISNGTTAGTDILKDLNNASTSSAVTNLVKTDTGKMFFLANHDPVNYGQEIYATDGTAAGTGMIKDLNSASTSSIPQYMTALPGTGKVLLFSYALRNFWISDGTAAGTATVSGLSSINSASSIPIANSTGAFISYNENSNYRVRYYFVNSTTNAATALNTTYLTDLAFTANAVNPTSELLFYGTSNSSNTTLNLWKSDGTTAGTTIVKNIPVVGASYGISFLGHIGNKTLFQYSNNSASPYVRQLWVTDGTAAGTQVIDTATNTLAANYASPFIHNGYMYFTRYHATAGIELWKTDGTSANTMMVKDINPGAADSSFTPLASYNGKLYFLANDGVHGSELWRTDGTLLGTEMVADINPGLGSSSPSNAKVLGGKLYFIAYKVLSGREVWVYSE